MCGNLYPTWVSFDSRSPERKGDKINLSLSITTSLSAVGDFRAARTPYKLLKVIFS